MVLSKQHSKDWLNWAEEFHLSSPEVSVTQLFLSQALQLFADQVRVSQVRRVGCFPACSSWSSGPGLWNINTANYKPDNYPSSDVYGNDLAGLNNDLTCPLYAYSVGKNKQSRYAWSDNYTSYKYVVFIYVDIVYSLKMENIWECILYKISSSWATRVPHWPTVWDLISCFSSSLAVTSQCLLQLRLNYWINCQWCLCIWLIWTCIPHIHNCNNFIHFSFYLACLPFFC